MSDSYPDLYPGEPEAIEAEDAIKARIDLQARYGDGPQPFHLVDVERLPQEQRDLHAPLAHALSRLVQDGHFEPNSIVNLYYRREPMAASPQEIRVLLEGGRGGIFKITEADLSARLVQRSMLELLRKHIPYLSDESAAKAFSSRLVELSPSDREVLERAGAKVEVAPTSVKARLERFSRGGYIPQHIAEEQEMLAETLRVAPYRPIVQPSTKLAEANQRIARTLRTALGLSHPQDPSEADHSRWRRSTVPRKVVDRKVSLALRHLADALDLPLEQIAGITITPTAIIADVIEQREDGQRARRDGAQIETRRGAFYTYRPKASVTYTNGA